MISYAVVFTAILIAVSWLVGRLLRWEPATADALILIVAFVNAGNFGLSMILLAFGEPGLELGTIFFVASNLIGNTFSAFLQPAPSTGRVRPLSRCSNCRVCTPFSWRSC